MNDMRPQTLADIEREYILATLEACEGNRTRAADVLGISIRCLRNRLHLFAEDGIKVPEPKTGVGKSKPLDYGRLSSPGYGREKRAVIFRQRPE